MRVSISLSRFRIEYRRHSIGTQQTGLEAGPELLLCPWRCGYGALVGIKLQTYT